MKYRSTVVAIRESADGLHVVPMDARPPLEVCREALALLERIANRFGVAIQGTDCDTLKVRIMLEDVIRKEETS